MVHVRPKLTPLPWNGGHRPAERRVEALCGAPDPTETMSFLHAQRARLVDGPERWHVEKLYGVCAECVDKVHGEVV